MYAIIIHFVYIPALDDVSETKCKFCPHFSTLYIPCTDISSIGNGLHFATARVGEKQTFPRSKESHVLCSSYLATQTEVELQTTSYCSFLVRIPGRVLLVYLRVKPSPPAGSLLMRSSWIKCRLHACRG